MQYLPDLPTTLAITSLAIATYAWCIAVRGAWRCWREVDA